MNKLIKFSGAKGQSGVSAVSSKKIKFYSGKTKTILVLAMFLFAGLQGCNKNFFQEETSEKKDPLEAQLKKLKEQGETGVFSLEEKNGKYHLKKEDFKELDRRGSFWLGGSYDDLPAPPLCTFCGETKPGEFQEFLKCFADALNTFGAEGIGVSATSTCIYVVLKKNPKKPKKKKPKNDSDDGHGSTYYAEFEVVEDVEFSVIDVIEIEDVELE